jgi:hypothetical protein
VVQGSAMAMGVEKREMIGQVNEEPEMGILNGPLREKALNPRRTVGERDVS